MGRALSLVLVIGLACPLAACGLLLDFDPADPKPVDGGPHADGGGMDAGRGDAGVRDAGRDAMRVDLGPTNPCFGLMDGDDCSGAMAGPARLICISGECVPSVCGDAFLDLAGGEQCEPIGDPECDPRTCRFECLGDADCPDLSHCLARSCTSHHCLYVADHGGTPCSLGGGTTGVCAGGLCLSPGCGNGALDPGEDCDLGTAPSTGCHACSFDCHSDDDCSDGDPCNGLETCDPILDAMDATVGQACQPSPAIFDCAVPPPCFGGGCVVDIDGNAMCEQHLLEADGDGFAADASCGSIGGDCDDFDPNVHPGAIETCNMVDDDCNGIVDDNTMVVTWCRDADGDGFGDPTMSVTSCMPPAGSFVRDCTDCWDDGDPTRRSQAARVHPLQTAFFTTPYCPGAVTTACSFDYDCDHNETEQHPDAVMCGALAPLICSASAGWQGGVPACGVMGTFATCHSVLIGLLCRATSTGQTQACR